MNFDTRKYHKLQDNVDIDVDDDIGIYTNIDSLEQFSAL